MRKVKKLLGLLLAAVMVLAMGVPTFAASGEYTITINNALAGHTYQAYQVFAGDLSENEETLSNVTWGDGVDGTAILTALKGTEEETTAYENCTTAADVAKVLETYGENSSEMKAFADIVGQHLTETTSGTLSAYNSENQSYTISGLAAGYYLVKDKDDTVSGADAYTDFILKVVKNTEATPKSDVPTVEKKVQEDDKYNQDGGYGNGYNDVADWNIGDAVPFKLIGTLPTNFADYDTYQYIFHDTLSAGLDLNEGSIKVYYASNKAGTDKTEIPSEKYTVNVPGTEKADQCSFEVAFADLTSVEGVTAEKYIIVEYTATLKKDAEIGLPGNPNKVYLEFSNNPNSGGEGDTGETPEDKVIVFTYELDVTKVDGGDGENAGKKLKDAEFKLYDANGKYVIVDDEGKVTGWADNEEGGSILKSGEDGLFKVIGLDDGTYWLKETKAPDGYNLITDPIKIEIKATTVNDQEWTAMEGPSDALTALEIKVTVGSTTTSGNGDTESGIVATDIENNKGATLPETGGMGTTIFYVLGAILVLGAGVLLIARRRTKTHRF